MKSRLLIILCCPLLLISCRSYQAREFAGQGYEQLQAGRFSEASASFAKASDAALSDHTYRYNYLLSMFLEGKYDQVIVQGEMAFAAFDFNLSFLLLKAQAQVESRRYQEALQTYDRLFALDRAAYEIQAQVMEDALTWGEIDTARRLALALLPIKAYEKQALAVLEKLSPTDWYASALAYLTKEEQTQAPPKIPAQSK